MSLSQRNSRTFGEQLYSFWKFARPHTIIGTSLSVVGLCSLALAESGTGFSEFRLSPLLGALGACLAGNVYIVGLNQLEDVEIDRVNKPHLPVAAGEFSFQQGQLIVAVAGSLALLLALLSGPFLLGTVGLSLAIGTAYSLPPVRLKRFPFWASFCIFTVRGVIVNLGLFSHFSQEVAIPPAVRALTLFVLGFTFAIAIFKDIPDMEGDRLYNITTFTIKLGAPAVLNLGRWVLTACYLGVALAGVFWLGGVNPFFLGVTHVLALGLMWWRSLQVDLEDKAAVAEFYQFIWKLFFLEYLIFPAGCFRG